MVATLIKMFGYAESDMLRRWLLRFCFCYLVLYYTPDILRALPGMNILTHWGTHLWTQAVYGMVGVNIPPLTGSGDTFGAFVLQAVLLGLALLASLALLFVRAESFDSTLRELLRILARYALAFVLLHYGFVKILPLQFGHLQASQLAETYGESSPMGLLWRFMSFSEPYTVFAGFAELLPAVLLVFRRTAMLGSLLAFAVMLNVVMLNFCYDVPVKLYSLNLLLLAILVAAPYLRRLCFFFVLNRPVPAVNLSDAAFGEFSTSRSKRYLKSAVLTMVLTWAFISSMESYRAMKAYTVKRAPLTTRGFNWVQEYPFIR